MIDLDEPLSYDPSKLVGEEEYDYAEQAVQSLMAHCRIPLFADIAREFLPFWIERRNELERYRQ